MPEEIRDLEEEEEREREREIKMERKSKSWSWVVTVVTQVCLCFGLYLAFNLGNGNVVRVGVITSNVDSYFISVDDRALVLLHNHSQLLDRVIKDYDAKFVLNLGNGNASPDHSNSYYYNATDQNNLQDSWYSTNVFDGKSVSTVKHLELPFATTLDVLFVNTTMLQDLSNVFERDRLHKLLASTLEAADSHWRIVIALHPVDVCELKMEQKSIKNIYEHMHGILVKYGVNVYLSRRGCRDYVLRDGIAYVGLPDPSQEGPYVMLEDRQIAINESTKEGVDVFLLHRISSLEMETYFVTLSGKVSHKIALPKQGRQSL